MVLCEAVHQDSATKAFTLRNIFAAIEQPREDASRLGCYLYIGMADPQPDRMFQVRVELALPTMTMLVHQTSPLPVHRECVVSLAGVRLPMPGDYRLTVVYEGEVIAWLSPFVPIES
jgi:hypothetical protein